MKKTIYYIATALIAVGGFAGCQDRLRDEFQNPEQNAPQLTEVIPGMLTTIENTFLFHPNYWDYYATLQIEDFQLAQIAVTYPAYRVYWVESNMKMDGSGLLYRGMNSVNRFNKYYTDLKDWGIMRDLMGEMSDTERTENEMFFLAVSALKCVGGLQQVDNFGDVPYSEAFRGTEGVFYPKYEDASAVYRTILNELVSIRDAMPAAFAAMSPEAKASFTKNDLAMAGSGERWVQFVNAMILRYGVRISGVDEAFAKPLIAGAIGNLPTEDVVKRAVNANFMDITTTDNGTGNVARAYYENNIFTFIPNIIMQRMNDQNPVYTEGVDDPRLPVIATPSRYTDTETPHAGQAAYVGMTMNYEDANRWWPNQVGAPAGTVTDGGYGVSVRVFYTRPTNNLRGYLRNCYSSYNLATYVFNEFPGYYNSVAENDLLLAEVALKGLAGTGKTAAQHVHDAVVHSTDMWYAINANSKIWTMANPPAQDEFTAGLKTTLTPTKPSASVISQYADKVAALATGGQEDVMEIIMQQKYIHLNMLDLYGLFADLRRTRHPKLEKVMNGTEVWGYQPERYLYPESERQNNRDAYAAVAEKDKADVPIFWVPEAKRSESYFMEGWLPYGDAFGPLPADPTLNPNRQQTGGTGGFSVWNTSTNKLEQVPFVPTPAVRGFRAAALDQHGGGDLEMITPARFRK